MWLHAWANGDLAYTRSKYTRLLFHNQFYPCGRYFCFFWSFWPWYSTDPGKCHCEVTKQVPRIIPPYKKANSDQLKQSIRDFYLELTQSSLATTDVQSLWDKFVTRFQQGIDKFIPVRKAGTWGDFPWINREIRRLIRKRGKLYENAGPNPANHMTITNFLSKNTL